MKHIVKYNVVTIPGKLRLEVRLAMDDQHPAEFNSSGDTTNTTNINLRPFITLQIIRQSELDENGQRVRAPWNPNDSLSMTKYTFPIMLEELKGIKSDMKIPELYTYHGNRLELNEEIAQKVRRVFMIGNTTLELSAQVITQPDDSRVEGIKMKFNNEASSVMLTLNDMTSLCTNLDKLDVDNLTMMMYVNFWKNPSGPKTYTPQGFSSVDIAPK